MYYLVLIETPYNPSDARVKLNFSLTNLMPKFIFLSVPNPLKIPKPTINSIIKPFEHKCFLMFFSIYSIYVN